MWHYQRVHYRPRKTEAAPRKRRRDLDGFVRKVAKDVLEKSGHTIPEDVRIYAVHQRRGSYHPKKRYVKIPDWTVAAGDFSRPGYDVYYIAHELAHVIVGEKYGRSRTTPHGPEFMEVFKSVCPTEYWHYETGYKPRNSKRSGISKSMFVNLGQERVLV